jgi:hypothetical protein
MTLKWMHKHFHLLFSTAKHLIGKPLLFYGTWVYVLIYLTVSLHTYAILAKLREREKEKSQTPNELSLGNVFDQ